MLATIALGEHHMAVWHDDGSLEIASKILGEGDAVRLAPAEAERLGVLLGSPAYSVEQALSTLAPVVGRATIERLRSVVDQATAAIDNFDERARSLVEPVDVPTPAAGDPLRIHDDERGLYYVIEQAELVAIVEHLRQQRGTVVERPAAPPVDDKPGSAAGYPNGGTYTLTTGGATVGPFPFDATPEQVRAALGQADRKIAPAPADDAGEVEP